MSQQVWRWTLPILWLRPQPPLPPPNPKHRRTGCALARRASASWAARDPVIRRLIITHDGVRQDLGATNNTWRASVSPGCFGASVSLRVMWALDTNTVCQHTKSFLIGKLVKLLSVNPRVSLVYWPHHLEKMSRTSLWSFLMYRKALVSWRWEETEMMERLRSANTCLTQQIFIFHAQLMPLWIYSFLNIEGFVLQNRIDSLKLETLSPVASPLIFL